jgi:hypothetical protein
MSHKVLRTLVCCALVASYLAMPPAALAVGGGLGFVFDESLIPNAKVNVVPADSLDFTYHACLHFFAADKFRESGYFWISSFQDVDSVVDSQINYIESSGYHIYGKYTYKAQQWGMAQPTPNGVRLNYVAAPLQTSITLFLDPDQDTVLSIQNCQVVAQGTADDVPLGSSNAIFEGEKSETNDIANGDFELIFGDNWLFTAQGEELFGHPANFNFLVFNGNVTQLGGALGMDHNPEGSGNLFWVAQPHD